MSNAFVGDGESPRIRMPIGVDPENFDGRLVAHVFGSRKVMIVSRSGSFLISDISVFVLFLLMFDELRLESVFDNIWEKILSFKKPLWMFVILSFLTIGVAQAAEDRPRSVLPKAVESYPDGSILLREFFSYGCSHCATAAPELVAASKKLKEVYPKLEIIESKVAPAPQKGWEPGARFFYVLLAQGLDEEMHLKVFADIDGGKIDPRNKVSMLDWAGKNGFDKKKAAADWDSPAVTKKIKRANELVDLYGVQEVPSVGINGRRLVKRSDGRKGANLGDTVVESVVADLLENPK